MTIADWCKLYEQYRGGKDAPYRGSKIQVWNALDKIHEAQCAKKKKKKKKVGDQSSLFQPCPPGEKDIQQCASREGFNIELIGDGHSTREATLIVTDTKSGAMATASMEMMCFSSRNHPPPQARSKGLTWSIGKPDPDSLKYARSAYRLAKSGAFDQYPVKDWHQVAQQVVWRQIGRSTPDKGDDVDENYFMSTLEKRHGGPFNKAEKAAAKESVKMIIAEMDLTEKNLDDEAVAEEPEKEDKSRIAREPDDSDKPTDTGKTGTKDEPEDTDTPDQPDTSDKPRDTGKPQDGQPDAVGGTTGDSTLISRDHPCHRMCIPPGTTFVPSDPGHQIMRNLGKVLLVFVDPTDEADEAESTDDEPNLIATTPSGAEPTTEGPGVLIGDVNREPCQGHAEFEVVVTADAPKKKTRHQANLRMLCRGFRKTHSLDGE